MSTKKLSVVLRVAAIGVGIALFALWARCMTERDAAREATFQTGLPSLDRIPVLVRVDQRLEDYTRAARDAMSIWNREGGCELLRDAGQEVPDVVVTWLEGEACGGRFLVVAEHTAASTFFCIGRPVEVRAQRLSDMASATITFAHEFGHVLHLAHDERGLMAPELAETRPIVIPSLADRRALKARYCGGGR